MRGIELPVWTATGEFVAMARIDDRNRHLVARLVLFRGDEHPSVKPVLGATQRLHEFIYDHVRERCLRAGLSVPRGYEKPRQPGYEVHHRNHIKFDARESNLILLTAEEHRRLTLRHRQRVNYRERDDPGLGWWRRHTTAQVKCDISLVDEKVRQLSPDQMRRRAELSLARPWHRGLSKPEIMAETCMATLLAAHRASLLRWEERDNKIPPTRRDQRNRSSRVHSAPRLGCWPGEVAFVMCFVASGFDLDRSSECLQQPRSVLVAVLGRPAVKQALANWVEYRRWPRPCLPDGGYSISPPPPKMPDSPPHLAADLSPPNRRRRCSQMELPLAFVQPRRR